MLSYAPRHPDRRESTVLFTDLASCPQAIAKNSNVDTSVFDDNNSVMPDSFEKSTDTSKPAGNSENLDVSVNRSSEKVGENCSSENAPAPIGFFNLTECVGHQSVKANAIITNCIPLFSE